MSATLRSIVQRLTALVRDDRRKHVRAGVDVVVVVVTVGVRFHGRASYPNW